MLRNKRLSSFQDRSNCVISNCHFRGWHLIEANQNCFISKHWCSMNSPVVLYPFLALITNKALVFLLFIVQYANSFTWFTPLHRSILKPNAIFTAVILVWLFKFGMSIQGMFHYEGNLLVAVCNVFSFITQKVKSYKNFLVGDLNGDSLLECSALNFRCFFVM